MPLQSRAIVAAATERLDAALQRSPKYTKLYVAYTALQGFNNTVEKAIPVLRSGLAKGDDPSLNGILSWIYLKEGNETQAVSYYQKSLSGDVSEWCKSGMDELLAQFKNPANQRAILGQAIPVFAANASSECVATVGHIIVSTPIDQPMGQEIIAALTPIAQSKGNFELSNALLGFMSKQGQFQQIIAIGPKLLPANGAELDGYEFMMAEGIPLNIAQAHEKLGNWKQSAKFYGLLSDYHQSAFPKMMTDRGISYIASWYLGDLAWRQGKAVDAIALLQPVTTHRFSNAGSSEDQEISYRALAHNLLGEIYQSQGKKAEARQQFEAAVKASEKFQAPKDNLAKLK
jgi:tetratricopeptide (TPR) repeat protein